MAVALVVVVAVVVGVALAEVRLLLIRPDLHCTVLLSFRVPRP